MPELPEVETVVRVLAPQLKGKRITGVEVLRKTSIAGSPSPLAQLLGRRVLEVFRRGKFIRLELDGGYGAAIHLRMTGWLSVIQASAVKALDGRHIRLRLELDNGAAYLVFRDVRAFGRVWCGPLPLLEQKKALASLGPEPLAIAAATFARRLRARKGRLKSLLLDQKFLAGIGNIYADETLFDARLHPLARADKVKPAAAVRLCASIQKILKRAIRAGGTTIDSFEDPNRNAGRFQRRLRVYGRAGEACVNCGAPIRRITVGQRGTWFCPRCQKRS